MKPRKCRHKGHGGYDEDSACAFEIMQEVDTAFEAMRKALRAIREENARGPMANRIYIRRLCDDAIMLANMVEK